MSGCVDSGCIGPTACTHWVRDACLCVCVCACVCACVCVCVRACVILALIDR